MQQPYHSHSLDHLGWVAGMFDELGIGDVIDRATQQNPETRLITMGNAVKAMVLNGFASVNQQLYIPDAFPCPFPTPRPTHSQRLFPPQAWHLAPPILGTDRTILLVDTPSSSD
jgi:Domain of unknown function (DUF4277)